MGQALGTPSTHAAIASQLKSYNVRVIGRIKNDEVSNKADEGDT